MSRSKKQQEETKKDVAILRLTITKIVEDVAGVWKREILDLEYKDINDAREMSLKVNQLLNNSEVAFACFGPDDNGKQKCFNKAEVDSVECELIEDPQIEKAKTLLQEIKDKVNKIAEKQHDHIAAPNYWVPSPIILEPRPWMNPLETQIVTYFVATPYDSAGNWHWTAGTSTTKLTTEDLKGTNLTDSSTTITYIK